jgi:hypothetical protein
MVVPFGCKAVATGLDALKADGQSGAVVLLHVINRTRETPCRLPRCKDL